MNYFWFNQRIMKKYYFIILAVFLISSCSDWKYGGRSSYKPKEVRYAAVVTDQKTAETTVINTNTPVEQDVALTDAPAEQLTTNRKLFKKESKTPAQKTLKSTEREDSTKIENPEEDALILQEALKAEKDGKKGKIFGVIGLPFAFTPLFIVGIVFSSIALNYSIKSIRSRYNTPEGIRYSKHGLTISIIGLVISVLTLVALLFIIFLLSFL